MNPSPSSYRLDFSTSSFPSRLLLRPLSLYPAFHPLFPPLSLFIYTNSSLPFSISSPSLPFSLPPGVFLSFLFFFSGVGGSYDRGGQ